MSVINLESVSNDELRRKVASLISLDDWSDECGMCGRPTLLHKGGPCTRKEREPPDIIVKIWSEFRNRIKPIMTVLKSEIRKETEDGLLLDGLKQLLFQISGQNAENMSTVVKSLQEGFLKKDGSSESSSAVRTTKLTKPAKVPSWSKSMTLETFTK